MALTKQDVLKRVMRIEQLPTLPEVMVRLNEVLENESSSVEDVTQVLECDPAIASRTLRLANSAFYGARFKVDTIRRAVVTIGFEAVSQLALATATLEALGGKDQVALADDDFWLHALGAAKAAQLLANASPAASEPALCFTGGLLHDLGKYVLSLALSQPYRDVASAAEQEKVALREVERRELGTDHAEVGAWLLTQWSLPPAIVAAVEHQYTSGRYEGPGKAEVTAISLSSDVAREAGLGAAGDFHPVRFDAPRLRRLGLSEALLDEVVDDLRASKDDARAALNLLRS